MKTCAFIGHRKIENEDSVENALEQLLEKLIVEENVTRFLLGSGSQFNAVCADVLLKMKSRYPHIESVYVRVEYPLENDKSFVGDLYDQSYFPKCAIGAGQKSYVVRNYHLIDKSDIVVFYYNENYIPISWATSKAKNQRRSGTMLAYNYAVKKKKTIINLAD